MSKQQLVELKHATAKPLKAAKPRVKRVGKR